MSARIQSTKGHDLYAFNTALKRNLKNAIYTNGSTIKEVAEYLGGEPSSIHFHVTGRQTHLCIVHRFRIPHLQVLRNHFSRCDSDKRRDQRHRLPQNDRR